jgi:catechol 2,3-dioxygenase-like lactoylglutathione lyase family enzyme
MAGLEKDRNAVASTQNIDLKLEVVVIPVADVDRAKEFYGSLGWRLDADFRFDNGFRIVQFTPPGSRCFDSIRHQDLVAGSRLSTKPLSRRS